MLHIKFQGKGEQVKTKAHKNEEIIKIKVESNEIETNKSTKNERAGFQRRNKINEPLTKFTIRRKEKIHQCK